MEAIDAFLADLARLEEDAHQRQPAAPVDASNPFRKFAVQAIAPCAPDQVQIVPQDPAIAASSAAFMFPAVPAPNACAADMRRSMESAMRPAAIFQHLPLGSSTLRLGLQDQAMTSNTSRMFLQVPVTPARIELAPKQDRMVLHPLDLEYECRAVAVPPRDVVEGCSAAMIKTQENNKQNIGAQPFAPGGRALTDVAGKTLASTGNDQRQSAYWDSPAERDRTKLALEIDVNADPQSLEEAILEQLEITAPGLKDCLRLQDIRKDRTGKSEQDGAGSTSHAVSSIGEALQGAHRSFKETDTSFSLTPEDDRGNALLALDDLLREMDDDDDLAALGFDADENEDESKEADAAHASGGEAATRDIAEDQTSQLLKAEDLSLDDPEAAVERILDLAEKAETQAKNTSANANAPWATLARVNVSRFNRLVPHPALDFAFELDSFQKECIVHLERHESVFVAAHTSAGKTVVAEYAIALSQQHRTRTIYTSPIKALSNQKYRDFCAKFGPTQVGLLTGDASINADAPCLVMTTEILRSMLYRGADLIRDLEWVVFDEIHYINDAERGVVWEEVLIMLPAHVGLVLLSATTPNHLEFSDWIGRTKQQKIYVVSTSRRPVPLQHWLYADKTLFQIYDATQGYRHGGYTAAKAQLDKDNGKDSNAGSGARGGKRQANSGGGSSTRRTMGRTSRGDQSDWMKLLRLLQDRALLPVVVFAFSKRLCEESASKLNKLDLSSASERAEIYRFLESSLQRLHGSDRELPQVVTMREMLLRGVGVHHGGLLPILKEIVEMLFARGLVRVLFATETFAMGVNMPARTVVFNGLRKHDGRNFRDLLPGEYTQMAGRAGRRGLDEVGTVIITCWDAVPEPTSLQRMLAGQPTRLASQFRLTYNMILNLLRVEVLTVEDMMKRSFSEFHTQKALAKQRVPQRIQRAKELAMKLEGSLAREYPHLERDGELQQMEEWFELKQRERSLAQRLVQWMLANNAVAARTAIAPGRVVVVRAKGLAADQVAVVVRTSGVQDQDRLGQVTSSFGLSETMADQNQDDTLHRKARKLFQSITVITLCPPEFTPPQSQTSNPATAPEGVRLRSKRDDDVKSERASTALATNTTATLMGRSYAVLEVDESTIDLVTTLQVEQVDFQRLVHASSPKELAAVLEFLCAQEHLNPLELALIDIIHDLKIHDLGIATAYTQWQQLHASVLTHPSATTQHVSLSESSSTSAGTTLVQRKVEMLCKLRTYAQRLTQQLANDALSLFPDFQQRLEVLRSLGYLSLDGVVQVKGRVACEINTCDELVLTEMIFENVLATLEPEEIVAVLSALIFQEKSQSEPTLTPRLEDARDIVTRIAESVTALQSEQHVEMDNSARGKSSLNFALMEVVYEWARGRAFKDLCALTDVQEGSIVRCITRLDEVCREVRNAARVIGDPTLFHKMEVASEAIKRDVVFAASLYLS